MTQPTELVVNVAIDFAPVDGTRNRFVFTKVKLERRHGDEQQILAGKDMPQATISLPSELKRHAWFIESLKLYESVVSPTVVDKKVRQAYNTAYQEELLHYRKPEAAGIGISSTLAMLGLFIRIKREAEQGSGNDVSQFFVRLNFEPTFDSRMTRVRTAFRKVTGRDNNQLESNGDRYAPGISNPSHPPHTLHPRPFAQGHTRPSGHPPE